MRSAADELSAGASCLDPGAEGLTKRPQLRTMTTGDLEFAEAGMREPERLPLLRSQFGVVPAHQGAKEPGL